MYSECYKARVFAYDFIKGDTLMCCSSFQDVYFKIKGTLGHLETFNMYVCITLPTINEIWIVFLFYFM